MKLTAEQIIAALPSLSRQDRLAVRAACDTLLQGKSTLNKEAFTLYEIIAKGVGSSMPWARVPAALQSALAAAQPGLQAFIDQTWPGQSRVHNIMITQRLLAQLAGDLHERQIPVSVATIIRNLGRIQDVFDDAYPKYRQAGLAGLILKQWMTSK